VKECPDNVPIIVGGPGRQNRKLCMNLTSTMRLSMYKVEVTKYGK